MGYKDKEKQREYQRKWRQKRRDDWFDVNGPCSRCGSWDRLQIHHLEKGDKIEHRLWSWSKQRRDEELKKCIVLCLDCHADVHGLETSLPEHGEWQRYKSRRDPCRCDLCRAANTEYERRRKGLYVSG